MNMVTLSFFVHWLGLDVLVISLYKVVSSFLYLAQCNIIPLYLLHVSINI